MKNDRFSPLDMMPTGWKKAFETQMLDELREILVKHNCIDEYRIHDISGERGSLYLDASGVPDTAKEEYKAWFDKYEYLSMQTCIECGKPATVFVDEELIPYCNDCMKG